MQDVAGTRYATALLDTAAAAGKAAKCLMDLKAFQAQIEKSPELGEAISNPTVPLDSVSKVVQTIAKRMMLDQITISFLALLAQRRRLDRLPLIIAAFEKVQDERAGVAQELVESAGPISDMQAEQISQAVGAVVNRRLQIAKKLDPTLLSGVRVTVGDRVFDLTTRSYLETLRNRLLENR